MCGKKPKVQQAAPAAAPVAAPLKIDNVAEDTKKENPNAKTCLLYTSDAADEL